LRSAITHRHALLVSECAPAARPRWSSFTPSCAPRRSRRVSTARRYTSPFIQIPAGQQGDTGAAGEVSQAALDGAIARTAQNLASVADLGLGSSDPVFQAIEAKSTNC